MTPAPTDLLGVARDLARAAHEGQVDKVGADYFGHPHRVALRARALGRDLHTQVTAYLHDVLEDTPTTADDLADAGFPAEVVDAVRAITKAPGEPREDYLRRVLANPVAADVKRLDVLDNADPARLAAVSDPVTRIRLARKAVQAAAILGGVPLHAYVRDLAAVQPPDVPDVPDVPDDSS